MTFFRYCSKCGNRFNPETKHQRLCKPCYNDIRYANFIRMINFRTGVKLEEMKKL